MDYDKGSVKEFDQNWSKRKETAYSHWTRGNPENQIQLAFRNHMKIEFESKKFTIKLD